MITFRPYQDLLVAGVQDAFRDGARAVLAQAPTGAGKTVLMAGVSERARTKGNAVLLLAHRRELIKQASAKLRECGVDHGIISPGFTPDPRNPVQVASVQTFVNRIGDARFRAPDLIIIDEAHHAVAGQWAKIIAAFPRARLLGVTATPERLDGRGLGTPAGGVFDALVLGPTIADLTSQGFLAPARVFAPADGPDLSGVRTKGGDYDGAALSSAMSGLRVVGDAVQHYARHAAGQPAILFSPSVAHAEAMAEAFRAAGWRARAASGASPPAERDAAIAGLATGAVQVLCSCDLISEGLDVPAVGAVILMRPTKSLGLYLQQVGRGLRPAPGKTHLTVLDHAGNTLTHGLIADDRDWSLAGRKKRPANPGIRQCKTCFAIHTGPKCSECGAMAEVGTGAKREVEVVAGELQEMQAAPMVNRDDPVQVRLRSAPLNDLIREAAGSQRALAAIAKARGFKPGWAWVQKQKWQDRQPNAATAAPPAPARHEFSEVDRWLRGAA